MTKLSQHPERKLEKLTLVNREIVSEAPIKQASKKQPNRDALIESIDDAYAKADKDTVTIGSVIRSLEAELGDAKFSKETKTTVRSRLKELMIEPSPSAKPPAKMKPREPLAVSESDSAGNRISAKASSPANKQVKSTAFASTTGREEESFSRPRKTQQVGVSNGAADDEPSTSTPSRSPSTKLAVSSSERRNSLPQSRKSSPSAHSNGTFPILKVGNDGNRSPGDGLPATREEKTASPDSDAPSSGSSAQSARAATRQSEVIELLSDNEVIEIE